MRNYVIKRFLQLIPILFVITFLSFGMMRLAGSDAVLQKMENTGMVMSQDKIEQAAKRAWTGQAVSDTVLCLAEKSAAWGYGRKLYLRRRYF